MNSKYFAMLAFSAVFLSPATGEAKSKPSITVQKQKASQTALTKEQKLEPARQEEENVTRKANLIVDNLLPYLENQWVEGYYPFIYKDPIYMTTGIGTKFSIGKTKMNNEEKARAAKGEIIVNDEVMLDQIPFRHKSTGKKLTYEEKVAYAKRAKATSCNKSFDGYKSHRRLANEMDVVLTREDARKVTRAELVFKIKRIRKLIQKRYGFDIFEKPMAVQMAFTDIAFMAGEHNMMQFKNALAYAKAGNYSKLPNYTDCGKGRARNNMRRNFVRLAALEKSYNEKEIANIKQALNKYDLDLPLVQKIQNDHHLLAQTEKAKQQLNDAKKTIDRSSEVISDHTTSSAIVLAQVPTRNHLSKVIAAHTTSPTIVLAQIPTRKGKEDTTPVLDMVNNNFFSVRQGLSNPYDKIAEIYLDNYSPIRQNKVKKQNTSFKAPQNVKSTSRQG